MPKASLAKTETAPFAESEGGQYVVVARRYRPQTFDQLIGQQHVAKALEGAISSGRVGHAYLFTGARGVGKTSAARILAKALDCVHGPTPTPCNECDICQSISTGDDVDVLEIDGASNRGIDEIRELRQNVNVRPSRARFKIYIIDEVHMLTREAFNALLKTLEEPPEHVKFIFCTTEAEKIPITILSRCQRFDFAGIQTPSIAERLHQIAAAEGVEAEPGAIEILARRAAGSMRDSQSLLEQLLAFGGTKIAVADVHRMLGTAADGRLLPLAKHLASRNAAAALAELDAALAEGVDVGQLLEQLLGFYRDLMVASVGASEESFLYLPTDQQSAAAANARQLGVETIMASMQVLDQALTRMRYSVHGRTLAEMALVRICQLDDLNEVAALIEQVRGGALPATGVKTPGPVLSVPARELGVPTEAKKKGEPTDEAALTTDAWVAVTKDRLASEHPHRLTLTGEHSLTSEALHEHGSCTAVEEKTEPSHTPLDVDAKAPLDEERLHQLWPQVLAQLSDLSSANMAVAEPIAICAPNRLVLRFREKYTSCKAFLERPEQIAKLEQALLSVTGEAFRVQFELAADPLGEQATVESRPRPLSNRERLHEVAQHPLVRKTMELFDACPVRVDGPASSEG